VKVQLRNPTREIEMRGPVSVNTLLARLELNRESFLVIRGDELVPATPCSTTTTTSRSVR
jgi:sulfur carrier protein